MPTLNQYSFRHPGFQGVHNRAISNLANWKMGPINTYSTAYDNAFNAYKAKLEEQQKFDDLQTEVVFLVVMVSAGALASWALPAMAAMLSGGTGGKLSRFLSRTTMTNHMTTITNTSFFRYVSKGLRSEFQTLLKKELKLGVVDANQGSAASARKISTTADMRWSLELDALEAFNHILKQAYTLDQSDLSDEKKAQAASDLLKTPFMKDVPSIYARKEELQDQMQLAMYMNYILDLDYLTTHKHHHGSYKMGTAYDLRSSQPISGSRLEGTYPTERSYQSGNFTVTTSVGYRDAGNKVAAEINRLFRLINKTDARFMSDTTWFNNMSSTQILLAELQLKRLMKATAVEALFKNLDG